MDSLSDRMVECGAHRRTKRGLPTDRVVTGGLLILAVGGSKSDELSFTVRKYLEPLRRFNRPEEDTLITLIRFSIPDLDRLSISPRITNFIHLS